MFKEEIKVEKEKRKEAIRTTPIGNHPRKPKTMKANDSASKIPPTTILELGPGKRTRACLMFKSIKKNIMFHIYQPT